MNEIVEKVLAETDPHNNPYFVALRDGSFEKDDFVETQIQFYYAVVFFSRPMAAVAAKIPSAKQRLEVLRNVWEEHGEGNMSPGAASFWDGLGRARLQSLQRCHRLLR